MKYIEARVFTDAHVIEPLSSVMTELGFSEFVIDDIPGGTGITVYLENNRGGRESLEKIRSAVRALGEFRVEDTVVDDSAWKDRWKEFFKPVKVSGRIVIKPTWEKYKRKKDELVIEMDPGMAFGTGAHPTTAMCIKLMEHCEGQFKTVLDIGCGSGILSISAALLGAETVLGVDNDPEAVEVAKANVAMNGLENRIQIKEGDLVKGVGLKADIVVANLIPDLVLLLAEDIEENLVPGGFFISSGILTEKLETVKAGVKAAGFEIIDVLEEDEWCAFLHRKKISGQAKL